MTFEQKNSFFIAAVVLTNTVGTLFLGIGMTEMPDFGKASFLSYTLAFLTNPWILPGIALLAVWMLTQISMYSWADLTYVLPVTASSYVFIAILSKFVLNEHISPSRWIGIALIAFGVAFVSETPAREEEMPPGGLL